MVITRQNQFCTESHNANESSVTSSH